jgi:predicted nucleic acid-binding protein
LIKKLIVDFSPLIVLLKSDLENMLPEIFEEMIVPEATWQEVLAGKEDEITKLIKEKAG